MALVLLDQNAPRGLRGVLAAHDVRTALQMGWDELVNGDLIEAAESGGFGIMVTGDQNLRYQQNLSGRRIALVVLLANNWPTVKTNLAAIIEAVDRALPGSYASIAFDRPPLLRRPPPVRFNP